MILSVAVAIKLKHLVLSQHVSVNKELFYVLIFNVNAILITKSLMTFPLERLIRALDSKGKSYLPVLN